MKNPKIIGLLVLVVALIGGLMAYKSHVDAANQPPTATAAATITEVTEQNFQTEVLGSKLPIVMVFYVKQNCDPCVQEDPITQKLANEYAGKVKFVKVDAYANPNLTQNLGVTSVPAQLVIKLDEKTIYGNQGFLDENAFKLLIEDGLAKKHQ
jgi:thioredoxin-like negative regulator of GroEL